jgi:hypothetical protein
MTKYLDPKSLGLPAKTIVEEVNKETLALVIKRKSRIIMADGIEILSKTTQIKDAKPNMVIILKTTTPVCSKTLQLFENNGLEVIKD